jgi:hypothetical protein
LQARLLFIILLTCFSVESLIAQEQEPSEEKREDAIRVDPLVAKSNNLEKSLMSHDSLIYPFYNNRFYHPTQNRYAFYQGLGDAGMPILPRLVNWDRNRGFQAGWRIFDSYLYTAENENFYRSFVPFTRMAYTQTKTGYVHLKGFHTQNISPGWNASLRFQTLNNNGFYPSQKNSMRQLGLNSRYTSKDNKYYIQGGVNWNRINLEENGGWADEATFDELRGTNKVVEVNLDNSSSNYTQNEHNVQQIYWFKGKTLPYDDSLTIFKPSIGIKHSSTFRKTRNIFTATSFDLNFLPPYLEDSLQTKDSIVFRNHTHKIGIASYQTDSSHFGFYAGAGIEAISGSFSRTHPLNPSNNLFLDGTFNLNIAKEIHLSSDNYLYLSGYNGGDFQIQGKLQWLPAFVKNNSNPIEGVTHGQSPGIGFEVQLQQREPAFIFQQYRSNHFRWENTFSKEQLRKITGTIALPFKDNQLKLDLIFQNISNPLYWDEDMLPNQGQGAFSQTMANFSWKLRFYRFHLHNNIVWQQGDSRTQSIFRTPQWSGLNSLYYQNNLFNDALKLQIGADLQWFSEYYANAYNPVTRTFHVQNRRMQGNYPLIDVFASAEIQTFRAFVKMEHFNFEMGEDNFPNYYYSSPGYSLPPRRLVIGFAWKFYL